MKKVYNLFVVTVLTFVFTSCGETEKAENKETSKDSLEKSIKDVKQATEDLENIAEGLKSVGGGEPIHYKDLQKFLPQSIGGYQMEDPEGATLNMQGFSVSSADAEYTSDAGDYVRISILDYNAAISLFQMSTAMWKMGITIDSDDEYAKAFSLNNDVSGWETFDKRNNKANVVAGIGNRLLITVEANNQSDSEKAKDILASMNLKSMIMVTNKE